MTPTSLVREALDRHMHVTPGMCRQLLDYAEALEAENRVLRAALERLSRVAAVEHETTQPDVAQAPAPEESP